MYIINSGSRLLLRAYGYQIFEIQVHMQENSWKRPEYVKKI